MKNLFLSVVLLLTVSFAFAANDVETVSTFDVEKTVELTNSVELTTFDFTAENYSITKVVGTCYVTIGFYDKHGDKVHEVVIQINDVDSAEQCGEIADSIAAQL